MALSNAERQKRYRSRINRGKSDAVRVVLEEWDRPGQPIPPTGQASLS